MTPGSGAHGIALLDLAGHAARLLPQRALWLPEFGALLVADVHLGKARSFRRLGVPVPEATTAATLDRLSESLQITATQRLYVLGDLLHSAHALAAATMDQVRAWRERWPALQIVLVRGNHDARSGDPPLDLRIDCVDGPLALGGLALVHAPEDLSEEDPGYGLAGHVHPAVVLGGRAHDALRLPCFHFGLTFGLLPAFGDFTGAHTVHRGPGDRVYAIADGAVVELSSGRAGRSGPMGKASEAAS